MNINDFYKMPTIEVDHEWFYNSNLGEFFDICFDSFECREDDSKRLLIETKISKNVDGERGIRYSVLTFDGIPFCLLIYSGRGWSENRREYITCLDTFNNARKYILEFFSKEESSPNIVSPEENIPSLEKEYGYFVYLDKKDNTTKLVESDCFVVDGDDYEYVLDSKEMRDGFEEKIRPIYESLSYEVREQCVRNHDFMKAYRKVIIDTIRLPTEDKFVIDFDKPNTIGMVRYKTKYYLVSFPSWKSKSNYLCWVLEESLEPIKEEDVKHYFRYINKQ